MTRHRHLVEWVKNLLGALELPKPSPERIRTHITIVERETILPVKIVLIAFLAKELTQTKWLAEPTTMLDVTIEFILSLFWAYLGFTAILTIPLLFSHKIPVKVLQYIVFSICLADAVFVSALALMTGGYDSALFWVLVGLVIRNAITLPYLIPQITANGVVIALYLIMGWLDIEITTSTAEMYDEITQRALGLFLPDTIADTLLLRVVILSLTAVCGLLLKALVEKQRITTEEAREFAARQAELKTASTIGGKIAHRIKNPLATINNCAFILERKLSNQNELLHYVHLIREEVARADRVITDLIGYAKLAEGSVKKLRIDEEIRSAIETVFNPPDAYKLTIQVEIQPDLPSIVLLKEHMSDILTNLLSNARDASPENGIIKITARMLNSDTLEISVKDQGPGIPPDKMEQIFEPYYTTKPHGSGLGLAIVKSTVELYGGQVTVENHPEGGTVFTVRLPIKVVH